MGGKMNEEKNMFKIVKNQIKFNPENFDNEPDTIQDARDYIHEIYHTEISQGSTVYFDRWSFNNGTIDFKVVPKV